MYSQSYFTINSKSSQLPLDTTEKNKRKSKPKFIFTPKKLVHKGNTNKKKSIAGWVPGRNDYRRNRPTKL